MKIKRFLDEWSLDGVLLTSGKGIRYHTGFTGSAGMGLMTKGISYLFVDGRYTLQGKKECEKRGIEVVTVPKGSLKGLAACIERSGIVNLGYEDMEMSVNLFHVLQEKLEGISFMPLGDLLAKMGMVKSMEEIECIKRGNEILERIFSEVVGRIREFETERDIAAYIEYRMKTLGSEGPSFNTIVAWRENSAFPHWKTSDTPIRGEGFLKMDFGCYIDGYGCDMTRTIYIGRAGEREREIYDVVAGAQRTAIESIRAGMTTREIDAVARDYISSKGYGEYFKHGLGHGLGLGGGELPYLSDISEEIVLMEGMVVTIEPGVYIEGYGGVRIEDDVVVTEKGCINLTKTTKELIEIGGDV